jgi:6-pyruvoyl-tetrahydropterin synthase
MIAHSFQGEMFGPAQRLHGATYAVEVTLFSGSLDDQGLVVDIGRAGELLSEVLAPLNYRNLDEMPRFAGRNTTTEVLAKAVHDDLSAAIVGGALGEAATERLSALKVTLRESPTAWATYEAPLCRH